MKKQMLLFSILMITGFTVLGQGRFEGSQMGVIAGLASYTDLGYTGPRYGLAYEHPLGRRFSLSLNASYFSGKDLETRYPEIREFNYARYFYADLGLDLWVVNKNGLKVGAETGFSYRNGRSRFVEVFTETNGNLSIEKYDILNHNDPGFYVATQLRAKVSEGLWIGFRVDMSQYHYDGFILIGEYLSANLGVYYQFGQPAYLRKPRRTKA